MIIAMISETSRRGIHNQMRFLETEVQDKVGCKTDRMV